VMQQGEFAASSCPERGGDDNDRTGRLVAHAWVLLGALLEGIYDLGVLLWGALGPER
jgi:hypothetical protein